MNTLRHTPRRAYWICFTPRTGSALLCQLLRATGVAGRPEEYFWRDNEPLYRAQWHVTSYRDYLDRALEEGTTPTASLERKWTPGCISPTFSGSFVPYPSSRMRRSRCARSCRRCFPT